MQFKWTKPAIRTNAVLLKVNCTISRLFGRVVRYQLSVSALAIWRQLRLRGILPACRAHARCTRRRVFVEQRPAGALCRWCSQCRSAARIAQRVIGIRSAHRILAGIRPSCGLSRRPGSRDPGISVGRKRHSEPSPAHFAQLANLALPGWRPSPHPATGHRSAFRERAQLPRSSVPRRGRSKRRLPRN
jgi:hypothetical protein